MISAFRRWWLALSTVLVWAAPAQVILISALGAGAALIEVGDRGDAERHPAVSDGGGAAAAAARRGARGMRDLLLPTHFTSVSMWVESLRLLPAIAREQPRRVLQRPVGRLSWRPRSTFGFVGYYLAAGLPPLLAGALLFLTPMSFLISTARNARAMVDRLALVLGLVIGPVLVYLPGRPRHACGPASSAARWPMPSTACAERRMSAARRALRPIWC